MAGEAADAAQTDSTGIQYENFQVTPSTYPRAADSKGTNTGDYKNGADARRDRRPDRRREHCRPVRRRQRLRAGHRHHRHPDRRGRALGGGVVQDHQLRRGRCCSATEPWPTPRSSGLWLDAGGTTMTAWGFGGGNDKTFTMPSAMNDGQWHHVVQTYSGTSLTIYIDGVALADPGSDPSDRDGPVRLRHRRGHQPRRRPTRAGSSTARSTRSPSTRRPSTRPTVTNHYQLGTVTVPEPIVTTTGRRPRLHRERHHRCSTTG